MNTGIQYDVCSGCAGTAGCRLDICVHNGCLFAYNVYSYEKPFIYTSNHNTQPSEDVKAITLIFNAFTTCSRALLVPCQNHQLPLVKKHLSMGR